jgi:hypothetical protein
MPQVLPSQAFVPAQTNLSIGYYFRRFFLKRNVEETCVQLNRLEFRGTKVERGTSFGKQQARQGDFFTWLSLQFFVLFASIDSAPRLPWVLEKDEIARVPLVP